jgi:hypothetical protein
MGSVLRTILIIGLVGLVLGGLGYWMFAPGTSAAPDHNVTEITDPTAAQAMVQISNPTVAQSESYVGNRVRLIGGSLKNVSNKPIRLVELKMQFADYNGNPIQEGVHPAFEAKQRPLAPGAEYHFEIAFEDLPRTWNYRPPAMQVVKVGY